MARLFSLNWVIAIKPYGSLLVVYLIYTNFCLYLINYKVILKENRISISIFLLVGCLEVEMAIT